MAARRVPPFSLAINKPIRWVFGVFLVLSVALPAGSVGVEEEQWDPTEQENVLLAISHVSGAAGTPTEFQGVFADGTAPAGSERRKYQPYMCKTSTNAIELTSDTATARVTVEDTMTSEVVGEVEWTLKKVGDEWKITAAPLP